MRPEIEQLVALLQDVQDFHGRCAVLFPKLLDKLKSAELSNGEACDVGWLARQVELWADETRKNADSMKELMGMTIAQRRLKATATDPTLAMRVEGELASGTPEMTMSPVLPRTGSPEYIRLLVALGVPEDKASSGALQIHYMNMRELLTRCAEQGLQPPEGLLDQRPHFHTIFRARRKVR